SDAVALDVVAEMHRICCCDSESSRKEKIAAGKVVISAGAVDASRERTASNNHISDQAAQVSVLRDALRSPKARALLSSLASLTDDDTTDPPGPPQPSSLGTDKSQQAQP